MTRIVTTTYRYKRPPRKRAKVTAVEGSGDNSMTLEERVRHRAYELWEEAGRPAGRAEEFWQQARAELEAEIMREQDRTPEEHKRRGDGADAMFQEMKRQIAHEARRNRP